MSTPKGKGGTTKKKKLAPAKQPELKLKIKKDHTKVVAARIQSRRSTRLRRQESSDAFGDLTILAGPAYVPFPTPTGAKAGGRGCKSARVVLGPLVGWPEPQPGTDAEAKWPSAILEVKKQIDNSTYHWKSGHVINADFGGYGKSNENMTCLTSSANTSQTLFDNNIKKARTSLHKVYSAFRKAMQQDDFFVRLKYGIEINIEMSDDAWGPTFPHNCVSNSMSLRATILREPAEGDIRTAMGRDAKESDIQAVLGHIVDVQDWVNIANGRNIVYNNQ